MKLSSKMLFITDVANFCVGNFPTTDTTITSPAMTWQPSTTACAIIEICCQKCRRKWKENENDVSIYSDDIEYEKSVFIPTNCCWGRMQFALKFTKLLFRTQRKCLESKSMRQRANNAIVKRTKRERKSAIDKRIATFARSSVRPHVSHSVHSTTIDSVCKRERERRKNKPPKRKRHKKQRGKQKSQSDRLCV